AVDEVTLGEAVRILLECPLPALPVRRVAVGAAPITWVGLEQRSNIFDFERRERSGKGGCAACSEGERWVVVTQEAIGDGALGAAHECGSLVLRGRFPVA